MLSNPQAPELARLRTRAAEDDLRRRSVELRASEEGTFEAVVSRTGVTYKVGGEKWERLAPGAFAATNQTLPVFVMHDWHRAPIGSTSSATEDKRGLVVRGRFYIDSDLGRRCWQAAKDGALREWSIGFRALKVRKEREGGRTVEVIESAQVVEVSTVVLGAVPDTETLKVASRGGATDTVRRIVDQLSHVSTPGEALARAGELRLLGRGRRHVSVSAAPLEEILARDVTGIPARIGPAEGQARPALARFLDRVPIIDVDAAVTPYWRDVTEAETDAAVTPYGTALPELTAIYEADEITLQRFGISVPVAQSVVDAPRILERFVNVKLLRRFRLSLEAQVLAGTDLAGVTTLTGVDAVTVGAGGRIAALIEAAATLVGRGYVDLVAAFAAADWQTLIDDNRDTLVEVLELLGVELVPTVGLPAGTSVVGAPSEGAALLRRGGTTVQASNEHADFFTRGLVALKIEADVELAADPLAFVKIEEAA